MNVAHLVTMANQIGVFFTAQGSREEAIVAIADHLRRFWEPRMRQAIAHHVADGGEGLLSEVAEAVRRLARPPQDASAARNESAAGRRHQDASG